MPSNRETSSSHKSRWVMAFRVTMAIIVVAALGYMISSTWSQLSKTEFRLSEINLVYWLLAVVAYVSAMFLSCLFWRRVLFAFGQQPAFDRTLLAFFASQLGKYVPGKAMVVIIRTDMIRGPKVQTGSAAASVFVETLTWIFVGSAIGSLLLVFLFQGNTTLQIAAIGLTLVAGIFTWPTIFQKIARIITKSNTPDSTFLAGLDLRTMVFGWTVMTIGWCLNGLSLWLVIQGMPNTGIDVTDFGLTLACVSLATVAGFVTLLPGGLGVRELVMIPLLGSRFGAVTAVIAAIIIRFVWLASELVTSGIIYMCWNKDGS